MLTASHDEWEVSENAPVIYIFPDKQSVSLTRDNLLDMLAELPFKGFLLQEFPTWVVDKDLDIKIGNNTYFSEDDLLAMVQAIRKAKMQPSNTEFVTELMEFSDFGGLTQVAVIEALRFYSELVVKQERPEEDNGAFLSNQTWWDVNADLHRQMMARLHPEHAKKIEAELKERQGIPGAELLGRQAEALFRQHEWKKFNS